MKRQSARVLPMHVQELKPSGKGQLLDSPRISKVRLSEKNLKRAFTGIFTKDREICTCDEVVLMPENCKVLLSLSETQSVSIISELRKRIRGSGTLSFNLFGNEWDLIKNLHNLAVKGGFHSSVINVFTDGTKNTDLENIIIGDSYEISCKRS
ncbi:MAG: hypothetical protein Q7S22_07455 [Candidatus Micrarchaeota archaeon]|nr:hypothetical protein [Candidatus Micrarchaeota archaeon]